MRNRYSGPCYRCGKNVAVGAGHFESIPFGRWRVQHADCAIEWRGKSDHATEQRNEMKKRRRKRTDQIIAQGTGQSAQRARRRLRDLDTQKYLGESA